jgi:hypothetical protein
MTDQSNVIKSPRKLVGRSKENKMVKRYDVFTKKWYVGFWIGRSFKIIGTID